MTTTIWTVDSHSDRLYHSGDLNADVHWWDSFASLRTKAREDLTNHFFDRATTDFFGTSNQRVYKGAYIERQDNAPSDSIRWRVTWFDERGRALGGFAVPTLADARGLAEYVRANGFTPYVMEEVSQ